MKQTGMTVDPIRSRKSTHQAAVTWIFEQIARADGIHVDRAKIRRTLEETSKAHADVSEDEWWRWLIAAGHSLSCKGRVVDVTPAEVRQLTREGSAFITRSDDGESWYAAIRDAGDSVTVLMPGAERTQQRVPLDKIGDLLAEIGFSAPIRGLVVEPSLHLSQNEDERHEERPFERFLGLLRAERSDITIVITFALVSGLLSVTTPLAVEALVNTVAFGRFLQPVVVLSLMLLAFLVFQGAMKALQTFVVEIIQRRLFARIASDLSFRLPRTTIDVAEQHYPPELVNRFFDVVTVQKVTASLLLDAVSLLLNVLVGMAVLAFYHPYLLAFDVVLIILMLFTFLVLGRGAVKTSIKESKTKYKMASWLEDLARCTTAFRGEGAAEFALGRSDRLIFDYLYARKKHFRVLLRQLLAMLLIQALASTALLAIGGVLVINGQLSLGQLVAAELIVAVVVGAFTKTAKHIESFYDLMASLDKLGVLLDLPIERQDGLIAVSTAPGATVVVENASCSLPDGREILRSMSLRLAAGERVALGGGSGVGKSLLLDVLYGLRKASGGTVTIDDVPPGDVRPDILRRRVVLARDIEVFEASVAENVHLERPEISIADVQNALRLVGLLDHVRQRLPEGLETGLTASGLPLTLSQQRRLMLARLIAGRPALLLIDEILDPFPDEESAAILRNLCDAGCGWTILLVTGRPHLRAMMDRTVIIQGFDGRHQESVTSETTQS